MAASNAHLMLENFVWRIESVTPDYESRRRFRYVDPGREEVQDHSGSLRRFCVDWDGTDEDEAMRTGVDSLAFHRVTVRVFYPTSATPNRRELYKYILRDRHLIRATLETGTCSGYDDDNPSADVNLHSRIRVGDEVVRDGEFDNVWELVTHWHALEKEVH